MTICAIHQPNFFPWAGYFDKIKQADIFIFLDEVAYPKSGSGSGSWCNRVKLLNGGTPAWMGLPIQRESGVQLIKDIRFTNKDYQIKKILKSIEYNYKKFPHYSRVMALVEPLLLYPSDDLAQYNIHAIRTIAQHLGLHTKFIRQSELSHSEQSTALLIELTKTVEADTYLSGNGSDGYLEESLFTAAALNLTYQVKNPASNFLQDINPEEGGLSIIHLLMSHYDRLIGE